MSRTIRPATPEDASGIARVHTQSWAETYPGLMPGDFLARMTSPEMRQRRANSWASTIQARREVILVAEQDGEVTAFASGGPPRDHPGFDAELMTLYALKAAQGQGTGRALLHTLGRALHAGGARNLALWVLDVNPTRQWYSRQGAREAGEKTEGHLREIRMVWDDLGKLL